MTPSVVTATTLLLISGGLLVALGWICADAAADHRSRRAHRTAQVEAIARVGRDAWHARDTPPATHPIRHANGQSRPQGRRP